MQYLRTYRKYLDQKQAAFITEVNSLEPEELSLAVSILCEALRTERAAFSAKVTLLGATEGKLQVFHIAVDDDIGDLLETEIQPDIVEEAGTWLLKRISGEGSLWIASCLGRIEVDSSVAKMVCDDRLQFSLETRKFHSVFSHHRWADPGCVSFEVGGRKRTISNLVAR